MNLATVVSLHCTTRKMKAADMMPTPGGDHIRVDRPSTPVGRTGSDPKIADTGRMRFEEESGGTKSVGGEQVPMSKFAYVGDPKKKETWKFPVHNKRHAQLAIQMWHQAKGIPADKKASVISHIHRVARSHGITDRIK